MAVLTEKTNYKSGDTVSAKLINDTVETALVASKDAEQALELAISSKETSLKASSSSSLAAKDSSEAKHCAQEAQIEAHEALEKANEVYEKAQRGEFNGTNGTIVTTNEMFGLQIVDGDLIVFYNDGLDAPNLRIDEEGNLIYEIN